MLFEENELNKERKMVKRKSSLSLKQIIIHTDRQDKCFIIKKANEINIAYLYMIGKLPLSLTHPIAKYFMSCCNQCLKC